MTITPSFNTNESLPGELAELINRLPTHKYKKWIEQSLATLLRMGSGEIDRLDWKILTASLLDMERGFQTFYPYRHIRKVTFFGSARLASNTPEYQMAVDFGRRVTELGFMLMTGGGGGIMQAGNEGAGKDKSFGLNIQLPFEQSANQFIDGDPKLIHFKYFFTRKLFLLRESDAIGVFPGGFGTQDEAFECLTLCQTGRYGPVPLILIDRPGGDYWTDWDAYVDKHLVKHGLVNPEDRSVYTITDDLDVACEAITSFYRVYHSSRYVGEQFVIRLKSELKDSDIEWLNENFSDILVKGKIEKTSAFPQETGDESFDLPRLAMYFNQRDLGRLYQMISAINRKNPTSPESEHPERK